MSATATVCHHLPPPFNNQTPKSVIHVNSIKPTTPSLKSFVSPIRCCNTSTPKQVQQQPSYQTCKNCKAQFDPSLNHPRACRFHTAHFGGETKRKFESVYSGGTMSTPDGGLVFQYWHCCGSEDPFDPGCTAAPHSSYDD